MSFILDALKKVERQKSAAGAIRVAEGVLGKRSSGRSRARELLMVVGIAVISAGATAGVLWFLIDEPPNPEPTNLATDELAAPEPQPPPEIEGLLPPPPVDVTEAVSQKPARREAVSIETGGEESAEREGEPRKVAVHEDGELRDVESSSEPPVLVLQGTSVLRGEPVAVINDQRVFEGDRVHGALVIRIEERSVELEFDGRRFTIRL